MRSKLSGHIDPGSLIHRLTYQKKLSTRSSSGHHTDGGYEDVVSLRASRYEDEGRQSTVVMKEAEVQDIHFVHKYRSGISQEMRVVDEDGVVYELRSWVEIASKRWMRVTLRRVDQRVVS